jgi:hypothetical protein
MKKIICRMFCLVLFILTSSCSPIYQDQDSILGPRYEAKTWLESNPNPYAFAGNRFESTEAAVFVNRKQGHLLAENKATLSILHEL